MMIPKQKFLLIEPILFDICFVSWVRRYGQTNVGIPLKWSCDGKTLRSLAITSNIAKKYEPVDSPNEKCVNAMGELITTSLKCFKLVACFCEIKAIKRYGIPGDQVAQDFNSMESQCKSARDMLNLNFWAINGCSRWWRFLTLIAFFNSVDSWVQYCSMIHLVILSVYLFFWLWLWFRGMMRVIRHSTFVTLKYIGI